MNLSLAVMRKQGDKLDFTPFDDSFFAVMTLLAVITDAGAYFAELSLEEDSETLATVWGVSRHMEIQDDCPADIAALLREKAAEFSIVIR